MNIRITGQVQVAATLANLRRQSTSQARFQDQIVSGIAVKSASDNPMDFTMLARAREASSTFATSLQVAGEASNAVEASVSALVNNNGILARAKQIAISAGSPDSNPATDVALARELDGLFDRFLDGANAQNDGRYLFGGDRTGSPPFRVAATNAQGRPTAIAYDGSVTPAESGIGGSFSVEIGTVGANVFQSSAANSFQALINLRETLRNSTLSPDSRASALTNNLRDLETASSALSSVVGVKSGAAAGLESIQFRLQDQRLAATARADELGATDYTEAILRYQQEESAYQATLNVAAKLVPPSLFDLIR